MKENIANEILHIQMKTALWIIRWIVGLLFIFSGLIKVNDPMGLSYKMQEFFEVLNLHFLNNYALAFSLGMNVFEVLAGVAVIIGWRMKLFSWLLFLLIVFFTFLTGFALFSGKIKTCGCFGDCIPLTAAQSFGKDLILFFLILILVLANQKITPILKSFLSITILVFTVGIAGFLQWYVLQHLPLVDCLPYKKGNNIVEQMKMPEGATLDSFSIQFIYQKNGKQVQFDQAHFPDDFDSSYLYIDRKDQLVKKGNGLKPAIIDFSLQTLNHTDTTQAIFQQSGEYVLLMIQDGEGIETWKKSLKEMEPLLQEKSIPIFLVSAEAAKISNTFPNYTVLSCDATVLKTAARVKPTYYLMKGATIIDKRSYLDALALITQL
jgi:uncharacterized membrane protein YphA (DoxX/SURF4 family)